MDQYLAESKEFKVYSLSENAYVKIKGQSNKLDEHEERDIYICHQYGDPVGAIISPLEDYIVVVGHGISIYPLNNKFGIKEISLFNEPKEDMWTNGAHFESEDQPQDSWESSGPYWLWFRFVSDNKIYKMNAKTHELKLV